MDLMKRPLKYLLFDCDGVLINSEVIARNAELTALEGMGLKLSDDQYRKVTVGLSETEHLDLIEKELRQAGSFIAGRDLKDALRKARWSQYESDLRAVPGIRTIVEKYRQKIAVVSSSDRSSVIRKLQLAQLTSLLSVDMFTSDQVAFGKPSPELYELAVATLGVSSCECLAIEDSSPGVISAVSARVETWGFTGADLPDQSPLEGELLAAGAKRVFRDVASLEAAIDRAFEPDLSA
jgi:HAD superfamily hydrolase (TIGR01509 family)